MTTTNKKNVRIVAIRYKYNALARMRDLAILSAPPANSFLPTTAPCAHMTILRQQRTAKPTTFPHRPPPPFSLSRERTCRRRHNFHASSHTEKLQARCPISHGAQQTTPLGSVINPPAPTPTPLQVHLAPSLDSCKEFNPPLPPSCHDPPHRNPNKYVYSCGSKKLISITP